MMTRRAVFDEVGGFQSAFGADLADIDYCLRVQAAGYRIVFTPYAELRYRGPDAGPFITTNGQPAEEMRRVWADVLANDPYYNPNLTREFLDYRPRVD
jgi:GT2 family glycosyltransferase